MQRIWTTAALVGSLSLALGCGGNGSSTPTHPAPPAPQREAFRSTVHESDLAADPTLVARPHHTVVLDLEADAAHAGDTGEPGVDEVPYEIGSPGTFRFCLSDDDGEPHRAELLDSAGQPLGTWTHGDACPEVEVAPGRYTLRLHHGAKGVPDAAADRLFLHPGTPQTATVPANEPAGRSSRRRAGDTVAVTGTAVTIPRAETLLDTIGEEVGPWWALAVAGEGMVEFSAYSPARTRPHLTALAQQLYPVRGPDGDDRVALRTWLDDTWLLPDRQQFYYAVGESRWLETVAPRDWQSQESALAQGFRLVASPLEWNPHRFYLERPSVDGHDCNYWFAEPGTWNSSWPFQSLLTHVPDATWAAADLEFGCTEPSQYEIDQVDAPPVPFDLRLRGGTTAGKDFPPLLDDEVALFNACYGADGFPPGTEYRVVPDALANVDDLLPTAEGWPFQIHSILTFSNRALQLYAQPHYQDTLGADGAPPDGHYLVPDYNARGWLASCTDAERLRLGQVGSFSVAENDSDSGFSGIQYTLEMNSGTCVGCDLRGLTWDSLENSDLHYSDLSGSTFYGDITATDLTHTDLSGCSFGSDAHPASWDDVRVDRADLSDAAFTNFQFIDTSARHATFDRVRFDQVATESFSGGVNFNGATFLDAELRGCLSYPHLDGADLSGATVEQNQPGSWLADRDDCKLTQLRQANLSGATFLNLNADYGDLTGADLSGAQLEGAYLMHADLSAASGAGAHLGGAYLVGSNFTGADFSGADFSGAYLCGASLTRATLAQADFSAAHLDHTGGLSFCTDLGAATLSGSDLRGASLAHAQASGVRMDGVSWWGEGATGAGAVLTGAFLNQADLPRLDLSGAVLADVSLVDANLLAADLGGANLRAADLDLANLKGTDLTQADLSGASLVGAEISQAPGRAIVEVLHGPDLYTYHYQQYQATTLPQLTDAATTCPDGSPGPCAPASWVTAREPVDCTVEPATEEELALGLADSDGNILHCTSQRH